MNKKSLCIQLAYLVTCLFFAIVAFAQDTETQKQYTIVALATETPTDKNKPTKLILNRTGVEFEQKCVEGGCKDVERAGFKYVCKDGLQYYYRIKEDEPDKGESAKKVVKGYRGKIIVEKEDGSSKEFHCIERANGFKHLKPGTYEAKFTPRSKYPDNKEIYVTGNIFFHKAKYPCQLDGCIAPGTEECEDYGVKDSEKALKDIIEALGGWEKNKKIQLEVKGEKTTAG